MTKIECLEEALKGNYVYCKDIEVIVGYSNFGGGFYSYKGATDGGDEYLEIHKLPSDGTYVLIKD